VSSIRDDRQHQRCSASIAEAASSAGASRAALAQEIAAGAGQIERPSCRHRRPGVIEFAAQKSLYCSLLVLGATSKVFSNAIRSVPSSASGDDARSDPVAADL